VWGFLTAGVFVIIHFSREALRLGSQAGDQLIGSGLNGERKKLLRVLRDPRVSRVVVAHRDRLARFGFEMLEAALSAAGKRVVVVEEGEVMEDLVRDLLEILTSACGRLYGRRSARDRAKRALEAMGCG
jgi:predicted site-specific integrase-resolvase